jgi:hypothetical protein
MIELRDWIAATRLPDKPWLVLGKGPSFARRRLVPQGRYHLMSLNDVVRELHVDVAHMIDVEVVERCADALLSNCRWLFMPRRPHVAMCPGPLLEEHVARLPVLAELSRQGRLIWYNLSTSTPIGDSPVVNARFFSSEAAIHLLGVLGARVVRSLGVDGGSGYSGAFRDLEPQTMLANGQPSFDRQFEEIEKTVSALGMDYESLADPMRVFVGCDESQRVAAQVLEHSIKKFASRPVDLHVMQNLAVPLPKHRRNRPRTGFSFYRFMIPKLCNYQGRALYLDADMLVFGDLAELWDIDFGAQKVLCTYQAEAPPSWRKRGAFFQPGRQMSVMLLDCGRLDWDVERIVAGLDQGRYDYRQLMFDLCVVRPDEIADRIPNQWNCLEWYDSQRTKLLHYTVVPTQPWKSDDNPLESIWLSYFVEALQAGALDPDLVRDGIQAGHIKPSLAQWLRLSDSEARGDAIRASVVRQYSRAREPELIDQLARAQCDAARLRDHLAVVSEHAERMRADLMKLKSSWPVRFWDTVTRPVRRMRRALGRRAA